MGLLERLAEYRRPFEAILEVATCRECLGFADLMWSPTDFEAHLERALSHRDPGVLFETPWRMMALEEYGGELRFYAGGAGTHVYDQPNELGVFRSVEDAVQYAEAFLARGLHPEDIGVQRGVTCVNYDWGRAELSASAARPRD